MKKQEVFSARFGGNIAEETIKKKLEAGWYVKVVTPILHDGATVSLFVVMEKDDDEAAKKG